ncbi:MAG: hypothetical protein AAGG75_06365 [Bacteroidota bacterium]
MIDKFKKTWQQASEIIKEQANTLSDGALDKTYKLFDQWATVFPQLQENGLMMKSFGISVALSPAMEVVLEGAALEFSPERLQELIEENRSSTILTSIFRTMKMAVDLHIKTEGPDFGPIHLKIVVKIPPEIKVVLGEPSIL